MPVELPIALAVWALTAAATLALGLGFGYGRGRLDEAQEHLDSPLCEYYGPADAGGTTDGGDGDGDATCPRCGHSPAESLCAACRAEAEITRVVPW